MNQIIKRKKSAVYALILLMALAFVPTIEAYCQIEGVQDLVDELEKQDKPIKSLIEIIANWVIVGAGVVVLIVAGFNKDLARQVFIGYVAVVVFWMIIKGIFF